MFIRNVLRSIVPSYDSLTQVCSPATLLIFSSSIPNLPFLNPTWPTSSSSPDLPLTCEHYPNVKDWYRQDWLAHVKQSGNSADITEVIHRKTLISKGINKTMLYLENIKGKAIDGYRLGDICAHAWAIWTDFQSISHLPELMQRWLVCIVIKCVQDSLNLGFAITNGKLTSLLLKVILLGIINMAKKDDSMAKFKQPLTMEPLRAPSKKAKITLSSSNGPYFSNSMVQKPLTKKFRDILVTLAPEPISTIPDTNNLIVVTEIDDNEIGLINDLNNVPGAEDGQGKNIFSFSCWHSR